MSNESAVNTLVVDELSDGEALRAGDEDFRPVRLSQLSKS